MGKKVAVIAFDPVNGMGLFQYLESFFENGISYKTFAIGDAKEIKTNSGISITLDGVVSDLKGHEAEYDALVFACGDAMIKFGEIADKDFVADTLAVISNFDANDKLIAGHCAASVVFEMAGVITGKKIAVHPLGKPGIAKGIVVGDDFMVDKNLYTAKCESSIWKLMPELLEALK